MTHNSKEFEKTKHQLCIVTALKIMCKAEFSDLRHKVFGMFSILCDKMTHRTS